MLEKGFLRNQTNENMKHQHIASILSKTLLYIGVFVLAGTFIYLFVNWEKAESLVGMLLPFLVAGLGLIFVSKLIQRANNKLHR